MKAKKQLACQKYNQLIYKKINGFLGENLSDKIRQDLARGTSIAAQSGNDR
ncbi:hypothetical protein VIBNISO65_860018 [Vibrio nigripulchritudo SO65]|nr:hypothetical protein VIBNIAM115_740020 [Vibrio nigripulchritudo AM115]CCN39868.1 hypothetical protein VIBNIFTn2_1140058 [Vibrio nigripulchritudo FTn2]CCN67479.1 hypothetical protein VIBNIPon4_790018 [Vibrio nigripulchritudo POn4]CCN79241.1 hypothetical protein VIBNISO65_860018 [Vibrio nigripulchritudo SO65]